MDAATWNRRYAATELVWSAAPNQFVVAETVGLPPGRALDLAAGEGRNALWLAEQGWQVTAVDFSSVAIEKARRIAAGAGAIVDWRVGDVLRYRSPAGGFDLVLVAYLHLPPDDQARALSIAEKAVAPGGTLLVIGHDLTNLTEGVGGPQDPALLYSPDRVAARLGALRVEKAVRSRRPVTTAEGTRDAIDTLVLARRPNDGSERAEPT